MGLKCKAAEVVQRKKIRIGKCKIRDENKGNLKITYQPGSISVRSRGRQKERAKHGACTQTSRHCGHFKRDVLMVMSRLWQVNKVALFRVTLDTVAFTVTWQLCYLLDRPPHRIVCACLCVCVCVCVMAVVLQSNTPVEVLRLANY